jgi:hypothetical protein
MNEEFTGDGIGSPDTCSLVATWVRNTHLSDARCLAYDVPREKSAVDKAVRQMLPGAGQLRDPMKVETQRADRYALRQHLARAKDLAVRLADVCRGGDPIDRAILGSELSDELQALWKIRGVREEEWAEVLNFLQSALAQEEFERFQSSHGEAVRQVIMDHLAGGAVDPEDVVRVRMILRQAGLDPWKAISALDE